MGRKYKINHNFFNCWNKENAWLLGLLTADATIGTPTHPTCMYFYTTNYDIALKITQLMGNGYPIEERKYTKGRKGNKPVYLVKFFSNNIMDFLKNINCYGPKDYRNPFKYIPDEYKIYFIRGLFDGDGNIYLNQKNKRPSFSIAGRYELINEVYDWLCNYLAIPKNKIYRQGNTPTYYFSIGSKRAIKILYLLMYDTNNHCYNIDKYNYYTNLVHFLSA